MNLEPTVGRVRARGLALLAAAFAAGLLSGTALDRLVLAPRGPRPGMADRRGLPPREEIPARLRRLGLTPDQETRIREIFIRWQPRADSVMEVMLPQVRAIEHGMFQEMMCVLTPAQDSAYLAWREQLGLNREEGRAQMARVQAHTCPGVGEK